VRGAADGEVAADRGGGGGGGLYGLGFRGWGIGFPEELLHLRRPREGRGWGGASTGGGRGQPVAEARGAVAPPAGWGRMAGG
jgi:hypothetical protein